MQIGLLFTSRCNAACTHCTTSCGPDKTAALSKSRILELMNEAADIQDGYPLIFSLSGGEPFLDFPQLLDIVAYGAQLGGQVTCVTNGYWAASDQKAQSMVAALKDAGLTALGVSTSRYHQRYVRLDRVKRALETCIHAGIGTVLKVALARSDQQFADDLRSWAEAAGVKRIEMFPVLPYLRDGARLPDEEYPVEPGLPAGKCPMASLTIREDGTAYSCCSPGGFVEFLSLGRVPRHGLSGTYTRFLLDSKQQLLREKGPIHFAQAARDQGLGHLLRGAYGGVCDLCAHVASDPRLSAVADQVCAEHERRFQPQIIRDLIRESSNGAEPETVFPT